MKENGNMEEIVFFETGMEELFTEICFKN